MIRFLHNTFFALITVIICGVLLVFSSQIFSGILNSITICLCTLIPSMYCFMAAANIISNCSLSSAVGYFFKPFSRYILKISDECFTVFLLSLLGGYPIGAKLITQKLSQGRISLKTAQRMMYYCVNCSPAFLISGVSVLLWHSINLGIILYVSQVSVCFVFAIVTGIFGRKDDFPVQNTALKQPFSSILVNSVNDATKSMAVICSYVLLFGGIFALLDILPVKDDIMFVIKGFSEVTIGCQLAGGFSEYIGFISVAAFTSFGGICVFLQINSIVKGSNINMFKFFISKIIYCLLSTTVSVIIYNRLDHSIACFSESVSQNYKMYSVSPISSIFLIFLGIMMLFLSKKSAKIKVK